MDIKITKHELLSGEGCGPDMLRVYYSVSTKYFDKAKDTMLFRPTTSDRLIKIAIKKYNMWRCFST